MTTVTILRMDLKRRIEGFVRDSGLSTGDRVVTSAIAREFRVSRTPVEAALAMLAAEGILERRARGGYVLLRVPDSNPPLDKDSDDVDAMMIEVARLRRSGMLANELSTRELVRISGQPLPLVQRTLSRLEELGSIERKPGYGWVFINRVDDAATRDESNRFRQMVEPLGLLEEGFCLDPAWAADMQVRHEDFMRQEWSPLTSPVSFFEMNAAFHEGLAIASGNRFVLDAIRRQNQVRRLFNYDWLYGFERVLVNSREHLAILDCLLAGDREHASVLMRRHLQGARKVTRLPVISASVGSG